MTGLILPERGEFSNQWILDPDVLFLNHGSFGACPAVIQNKRFRLLEELESNPVDFFLRKYPELLFEQWRRIEEFCRAEPGSIVFVENATEGVNTVLRSLHFEPGDQLLTTTQEYFSSRNALYSTALRSGAELVEAVVPFPVSDEDSVVNSVIDRVTERTKLVLLDHISSPTGMIFPIERIVSELTNRGIDTLIDGAHGPGMVPLNLAELGAAYYTGNCHKWLCTPKSVALFYVRPDRQSLIHPLATSRLPEDFRTDFSDYQVEFFWGGTSDPTPMLCVSASLDYMGGLLEGGWEALMHDNRQKVLRAGKMICSVLGVEPPCPDSMLGSMFPIPLPWLQPPEPPSPEWADPLQDWLWAEHRIEVLITFISRDPRRILRISAQLYNGDDEYRYLAEALGQYPGRPTK